MSLRDGTARMLGRIARTRAAVGEVTWTRLWLWGAVLLLVVATGCSGSATQSTSTTTTAVLTPTPPATADVGQPTPGQTEGPYFKAGSPERSSLVESGTQGQRLSLSGRVLTDAGTPLAGATIEFWQADENGAYDNAGYRYRGHQLTGTDGSYVLETVVPGPYPGRTRHIHVKVIATGFATLTTQLYFPDEPANDSDGIFDSRLLVQGFSETGGVRQATFDFVLAGS